MSFSVSFSPRLVEEGERWIEGWVGSHAQPTTGAFSPLGTVCFKGMKEEDDQKNNHVGTTTTADEIPTLHRRSPLLKPT